MGSSRIERTPHLTARQDHPAQPAWPELIVAASARGLDRKVLIYEPSTARSDVTLISSSRPAVRVNASITPTASTLEPSQFKRSSLKYALLIEATESKSLPGFLWTRISNLAKYIYLDLHGP